MGFKFSLFNSLFLFLLCFLFHLFLLCFSSLSLLNKFFSKSFVCSFNLLCKSFCLFLFDSVSFFHFFLFFGIFLLDKHSSFFIGDFLCSCLISESLDHFLMFKLSFFNFSSFLLCLFLFKSGLFLSFFLGSGSFFSKFFLGCSFCFFLVFSVFLFFVFLLLQNSS